MKIIYPLITSAVIATIVSAGVTRWCMSVSPHNVKAMRYELVDQAGNIRGVLAMQGTAGSTPQPSLRLMDTTGKDVVSLELRQDGNPWLIFNTVNRGGREGAVIVGALPFGDTTGGQPEPLLWGITARGADGRGTSMALFANGGVLAPSPRVEPFGNQPHR